MEASDAESESAIQVLHRLDHHARHFEFPVLDNVNVHFIGGRLRGLRFGTEWALLFEILVLDPQDKSIVADVYCYGPACSPHSWRLFQSGDVEQDPETPLWSDSGDWAVPLSGTTLRLRGRKLKVVPSGGSTGDIQMKTKELATERDFCDALHRTLGFDRLVPRGDVAANVSGGRPTTELFSASNWDHPDVAGGVSPSQSLALRAAVRCLVGEATNFQYSGENANLTDAKWSLRT